MSPGRVTTLTVRTPEGVPFALPLAGPTTRAMAWLIDLLVLALIMIGVVIALTPIQALSADHWLALVLLASLVVPVGYGILFEWWWRGQTIGKRVVGLRVVDETGLGLTTEQIVMRNLLRMVDSLPFFYAVGGSFCALGTRCQRLGDLAAGTVVVRSIKESVPDVGAILKDKYNSFREFPHVEARLRQRVGPDEAQVALLAIARREAFDPAARLELFRSLAAHFRAIVEFPDEATHGLTDERYVRNVVDSLFLPSRK
ncbi:hypothetical protein BH23VER1_BH23VER1_07780 [soil metagenome]